MSDKTIIVGILAALSIFLIACMVVTLINLIKVKKGILLFILTLVMSCASTILTGYLITLPENNNAEKSESSTAYSSATFEEIYYEYKSNELRADEKYKNNRYTITANINGIKTGGLLNWSGGATLTMETKIDNTIVFFYAEFEKDQEEALKEVNVGDEITFEGECLSAGTWVECELID